MSEEMKAETVEVIITACEKFGTDYYVRPLLFIVIKLNNRFYSIYTRRRFLVETR